MDDLVSWGWPLYICPGSSCSEIIVLGKGISFLFSCSVMSGLRLPEECLAKREWWGGRRRKDSLLSAPLWTQGWRLGSVIIRPISSGYSGSPITSVSSRLWSLTYYESGIHQIVPWSPFLLHPPLRFLHCSLQRSFTHWALFPSFGGFIPTSSRISVTHTHCLCSVPVTSMSHQTGFHAFPVLPPVSASQKWKLKFGSIAWFLPYHPSYKVIDQNPYHPHRSLISPSPL